MCSRRIYLGAMFALALVTTPNVARAINIVLDYRYDTHNFFNPGTTNGMAAIATLEYAASNFSSMITDTLGTIPYTDPQTPNGNSPVWRQIIMHPGTGQQDYVISSAANAAQDGLDTELGYPEANEYRDLQLANNRFLIYVGATSLDSAGVGGTGVASYGSPTFNDTVNRRGKDDDEYSAWGGYVSFDNDGGANWHYNHSTTVPAGKIDLYTVALHEIGHVLGLSTGADQWMDYQEGAEFQGDEALAAWKADDPSAPPAATGIPTVSATDHHWRDNIASPPFTASVRSYALGTLDLQEAAMDPVAFTGDRKYFTNVDAKALRDIGWSIPNSVFEVTTDFAADFNGDSRVTAADLTTWKSAFRVNANGDADGDGRTDGKDFLIRQRQLGSAAALPNGIATSGAVPEPQAAALATLAGLVLLLLRRSARR